jgi:protein-tyrosine-phosphatase
MASILVVCTGNVCRSPVAEALLRTSFEQRFGVRAPSVASAGTAGWVGSEASQGSVAAAAELGLDLRGHRARALALEDLWESVLILAMAIEHRNVIAAVAPESSERAFTLKELVLLLEALPAPAESTDPVSSLARRVGEAAALRRGGFGRVGELDVDDPLGKPQEKYHEMAVELDAWCGRLGDGLFGRATARASVEGR